MFVRDHPPPVDFLKAHCQTKIERFGLSVGLRSLAAHARESEGDISAGRNVQLLNVKADQDRSTRKRRGPKFFL